jgi:hypothetical protein
MSTLSSKLLPANKSVAVFATFLCLAGLWACASSEQSQGSSENMTIDQFIQELQNQGLSVSPGRRISRDQFAAEGLRLETESGDVVEVFNYQSATSASMQMNRVSSSSGTAPFFYQQGNIVAVHRGTDAQVETALEAVLGPKE